MSVFTKKKNSADDVGFKHNYIRIDAGVGE
jgi:hypothetical protein